MIDENQAFNVDEEPTGSFGENPLNNGEGAVPAENSETPAATTEPTPVATPEPTPVENPTKPHPIPINPEPAVEPQPEPAKQETVPEPTIEPITETDTSEDPQKIVKSKKIIIIAIAAIFVIALGYTGFTFFLGGDDSTAEETTEPQNTLEDSIGEEPEEDTEITEDVEEEPIETPSEELLELDKIVNTLEDVYNEDSAKGEEVFEDAVLKEIEEPEEEEDASTGPPGFYIPEEDPEAEDEGDSPQRIRR